MHHTLPCSVSSIAEASGCCLDRPAQGALSPNRTFSASHWDSRLGQHKWVRNANSPHLSLIVVNCGLAASPSTPQHLRMFAMAPKLSLVLVLGLLALAAVQVGQGRKWSRGGGVSMRAGGGAVGHVAHRCHANSRSPRLPPVARVPGTPERRLVAGGAAAAAAMLPPDHSGPAGARRRWRGCCRHPFVPLPAEQVSPALRCFRPPLGPPSTSSRAPGSTRRWPPPSRCEGGVSGGIPAPAACSD